LRESKVFGLWGAGKTVEYMRWKWRWTCIRILCGGLYYRVLCDSRWKFIRIRCPRYGGRCWGGAGGDLGRGVCVRVRACVCMRVCIHTYIHTCIAYIHAHIHTYVLHARIHTYIHTYIHTHVYTYIHIYYILHICMCTRIYINTCIHTCICMHAYIHTCMHVCVCVLYVYACMCVCVCMCVHIPSCMSCSSEEQIQPVSFLFCSSLYVSSVSRV
jgi:hypothetical protein